MLFFGNDIKENQKEYLVQAINENLTLIALDSSAILLAKQLNVPFTILDDWISETDDLEARTLSSELEKQWYTYEIGLFTIDGICWPEFDIEAMFFYWKRVCFSKALSRALVKNQIKEVFFFSLSTENTYSLLYNKCFVHIVEFKKNWEDKCKIFPESKSPIKIQYYQGIRGRLRLAKQEFKNWLNHNTNTKEKKNDWLDFNFENKIVIIISPHEVHRIEKHIISLICKYPQKLVLILLGGDKTLSQSIRAKLSIPVLIHSFLTKKKLSVIRKLNHALKINISSCDNEYIQDILLTHHDHFKYYSSKRWPELHSEYLFWKENLSESRPTLVLTTSLPDAEYQLPALVASKLGIPSICLPHGIGVYRKIKLHSKIVLANFQLDQTGYILSGRSSNTITMCRDLGVTNEYPVKKDQQNFKDKNKTNALILIGETGHADDIFPCRNRMYQINGIKDLSSLKKEFSCVLELRIKLHPWINDRELFEAFEPELLKDILPSESDLEDALNWADFVIAVNYQGVAILHSFFHEKPVLLYWCNKGIGCTSPYEYSNLLISGGEVINSYERLVEQISLILDDNSYRTRLYKRALNFKNDKLNDKNHKFLPDIVQEFIEK